MAKNVPPRVVCHLYGMLNHHRHAYRRGDQEAHCPGRHAPGVQYVSTKRKAQVVPDGGE